MYNCTTTYLQRADITGINNNVSNVILPYANDKGLNVSLNFLESKNNTFYINANYRGFHLDEYYSDDDSIYISNWEENYQKNQENNIKWDEPEYQIAFALSWYLKKKNNEYISYKEFNKKFNNLNNSQEEMVFNISYKQTILKLNPLSIGNSSYQSSFLLGKLLRQGTNSVLYGIGYSRAKLKIDYEILIANDSNNFPGVPGGNMNLATDSYTGEIIDSYIYLKFNVYQNHNDKLSSFVGIDYKINSIDLSLKKSKNSPSRNVQFGASLLSFNSGIMYRLNNHFTFTCAMHHILGVNSYGIHSIYNFNLSYSL